MQYCFIRKILMIISNLLGYNKLGARQDDPANNKHTNYDKPLLANI